MILDHFGPFSGVLGLDLDNFGLISEVLRLNLGHFKESGPISGVLWLGPLGLFQGFWTYSGGSWSRFGTVFFTGNIQTPVPSFLYF